MTATMVVVVLAMAVVAAVAASETAVAESETTGHAVCSWMDMDIKTEYLASSLWCCQIPRPATLQTTMDVFPHGESVAVAYLTYAQAFACQEENPVDIPDVELVYNSTVMESGHHYVYETGITGINSPWSALLGFHCKDKAGCQFIVPNITVAIAY